MSIVGGRGVVFSAWERLKLKVPGAFLFVKKVHFGFT